jgi:hypothetical protein
VRNSTTDVSLGPFGGLVESIFLSTHEWFSGLRLSLGEGEARGKDAGSGGDSGGGEGGGGGCGGTGGGGGGGLKRKLPSFEEDGKRRRLTESIKSTVGDPRARVGNEVAVTLRNIDCFCFGVFFWGK